MSLSFWSAKAGAGCTALAVGVATQLSGSAGEVLLLDAGGDVPACAGLSGVLDGVTDWLAGSDAPIEALGRLEVEIGRRGVSVLPLGSADDWADARVDTLIGVLRHERRPVVVDAGHVPAPALSPIDRLRARLVSEADRAYLVSRACILSLRRATASPLRSTGVVLVREPGRSIDAYDVAQILALPVVAQVDHDPAVARAIDAGMLADRPPRTFERQLRGVA